MGYHKKVESALLYDSDRAKSRDLDRRFNNFVSAIGSDLHSACVSMRSDGICSGACDSCALWALMFLYSFRAE